jgi:GDP-4-dehydro-6-deoxy-D-mannose reductase
MTNVLITGADGFVGRHLSRQLSKNKFLVHGLSINKKPIDWPWKWHQVDLLDNHLLMKTIHQINPVYVFHLAALIRSSSIQELMTTNVTGTDNLLQAILKYAPSARVLISGSAAENGFVKETDLPVTETYPPHPLSPYGLSKAAQGLLADQYWYRDQLDIVRTRTFNLTGPGEPDSMVASAIAHQIAAIESKTQAPVIRIGSIHTIRDFLDVRDAVLAYWLVVKNGVAGQLYNVCSGEGTQIKQILQTLLSFSSHNIDIVQEPARFTAWDVPVNIGDPKKLHQETGFTPNYTLLESLSTLLDEARKKH